jgi:large subunit ribosomal protein L31
MKRDIHPDYGPVAFRDIATGKVFVTRSTLVSRAPGRTITVDGTEIPVFDVDITSDSHPFWTGQARVIDSEGRVQAFERRYGAPA